MADILATIFLVIFTIWGSFQPLKDEVTNAKAEFIQNEAQTAIQQAKIKGYFTDTDLQNIKDDVAAHLGYPAGEVTITGTTTPQTRGQKIILVISIPENLSFMHFSRVSDATTITRGASAESEWLQ